MSLGRGFDVLIPKNLDRTILEPDKNRVQKILIADIVPNSAQPRRSHDEKSLQELAASVKEHGILQPIIVVTHGKLYRIVAGERRWRAARAAKLSHMPAIVRSLQELEQVELALIENIQRVDLSPMEQALSVYRLQHQFNQSLEKIAKKLGKAPSTISNLARLLQLPDTAREALQAGRISEGHARAILALKNESEKQQELLSCILNNEWNVRRAEEFVKTTKKGLRTTQDSSTASEAKLATQLSQKLQAAVKIKRRGLGGQLVIDFDSAAQLQKIAQKLQK